MRIIAVVSVVAMALAAGTISSTARAETISVAYEYVEAGGTLAGVVNGHDYTDPNSADGVMKMATSNPDGSLASQVPSDAWAVCLELGQYTNYPLNTYQVQALSDALDADRANLIGQLWAQHYDDSWQTSTPIYYGGSGHPGFLDGWNANPTENQNALALTYAVYAVRYNFDGNAASLTVSDNLRPYYMNAESNPATVALANGWLGALDLNYTGSLPQLVSLSSPTLQDLVVQVPEPATMALLGMGGMMMLAARMRRRVRA